MKLTGNSGAVMLVILRVAVNSYIIAWGCGFMVVHNLGEFVRSYGHFVTRAMERDRDRTGADAGTFKLQSGF